MNIKAKMRCHYVERHSNPGWSYEIVKLSAVYSDDKNSENYSFSQATPSADISMCISNPAAFGAFELNKEYYLDFTPVS